MEEISKIATINNNNKDNKIVERGLYQCFLYRLFDINMTIDNTGYVYMLISSTEIDFSNIGKKNEMIEIPRALTSGIGSQTSQTVHIHPHSVSTYM